MGQQPLCARREGRLLPQCRGVNAWAKRQHPLQSESLRHFPAQEGPMVLIGFQVILLLSEGPVWQYRVRVELPESLLELWAAPGYSHLGASC